MNASAIPGPGVAAPRGRVLLATLLIGIALVAIWYLWRFVTPYASIDPAYYDYLWPWRHALWAHLAGGLSALLIGPVQLWLGLTRRRLSDGMMHKRCTPDARVCVLMAYLDRACVARTREKRA